MRLSQFRLSVSPLEELGSLSAAVKAGQQYESLPGLESLPEVSTANFCLHIPTRQGSIFLGEKFEAYISALNSSNGALCDVAIVVELHTPGSDLVVLRDTRDAPIHSFLPGHTIDNLVQHQVSNEATHSLICCIFYKDVFGGGVTKMLKKCYRLPAVSALSAKPKIRCFDKRQAIAEISLDNISAQRQTILKASLRVNSPEWRVSAALPGLPIFMAPGDISNLLFVAEEVEGGESDRDEQLPTAPVTATLVVESSVYGAGSTTVDLCEFSLQPPAPPPPIRLEMTQRSTLVKVEESFEVTLRITNDSPVPLDAELHFEQDLPVYIEGPSRVSVGLVGANSHREVKLVMNAVVPGMHSLTGISLHCCQQELVPSTALGELLAL